ncbi:Eco57I restriction-modification methylase domain-containing protein [Nocardia suismassiliense]|uniref:site-specific DNA-methyltransferase (adenine-specific) n=1 Tax=Nocardia suismassiliense TaxID=2077092 RepID=A0ABW6QTS0_9NOCA
MAFGAPAARDRKRHGRHYTPPVLARFLAQRLLTHVPRPESGVLRVLDPACGDGELLFALRDEAAIRLPGVRVESRGYDLDAAALAVARARDAGCGVDWHVGDFLTVFHELAAESFDAVITNPPYVRTQQLGGATAQLLSKQFGLRGRIDLTHPFVATLPRLLCPGGALGLLCANRFLTTKAGANIRRLLLAELAPVELYDLGDTKLFEAAVLPAITIATRAEYGGECRYASAYETEGSGNISETGLFDALTGERCCLVAHNGRTFAVEVGALVTGHATPPEQAGAQKLSAARVGASLVGQSEPLVPERVLQPGTPHTQAERKHEIPSAATPPAEVPYAAALLSTEPSSAASPSAAPPSAAPRSAALPSAPPVSAAPPSVAASFVAPQPAPGRSAELPSAAAPSTPPVSAAPPSTALPSAPPVSAAPPSVPPPSVPPASVPPASVPPVSAAPPSVAASFVAPQPIPGRSAELLSAATPFASAPPPGSPSTPLRANIRRTAEPETAWRMSNTEIDSWLDAIAAATWKTFGEVARIRVGIKTTADRVFISDRWAEVEPPPEPELLLELITHHDLEPWRIVRVQDTRVLYPYDCRQPRRTPIDLDEYPCAAEYLRTHKDTLSARHYLGASGREWFEIWVPQRPQLWCEPKVVFPDISDRPRFALDRSGAVVNGDCYWISLPDLAGTPSDADLLAYLLMGVANSALGLRFYDAVCGNRLYSGRRRWITQYVTRLPLPNPGSNSAATIIELAREFVDGRVPDAAARAELDERVAAAFGVSLPAI